MWPALVGGVVIVLFGIFVAVVAAKGHKNDRSWEIGVLLATIMTALGIFFISLSVHDMGRQDDPLPAVTEQGHIYEVLDSMKFKKGYLVSFKKMIPEIKEDDEQVRFFEEMPPNPFKSTLKEGKEVYVPFELPAPNPVK